MERTTKASSSLCVRTKNCQILVRGERYANHSQMAQRRFANRWRAVSEPFGTLVYTMLDVGYTTGMNDHKDSVKR